MNNKGDENGLSDKKNHKDHSEQPTQIVHQVD